MEAILDLEICADEPPLARPRNPLPMPDGKPVPVFFGRRFLSRYDLFEIGLVPNDVTLRRLIAEGRFPQPLELGRRLRLWDVLELQAFVDRLAAAREQKTEPAAPDQAAGNDSDSEDTDQTAATAVRTEPGGPDASPS